MDAYFPDDEEETGVADAPVDASGAFALSDVQAPTGGFQFVSVDDQECASCGSALTACTVFYRATCRKTDHRCLAFSFYTATGDFASPCAPRLVLSYSGSALSGRSFNHFGHLSTFSFATAPVSATIPCKNSTPFCLPLRSSRSRSRLLFRLSPEPAFVMRIPFPLPALSPAWFPQLPPVVVARSLPGYIGLKVHTDTNMTAALPASFAPSHFLYPSVLASPSHPLPSYACFPRPSSSFPSTHIHLRNSDPKGVAPFF